MFVIGYFIKGVGLVLNIVLTAYMFTVIVQALISWVNPDPYNPFVRFLYSATEPVYRRIRRILPAYYAGFDFSPVIVILAIAFLKEFLVNTLLIFANNIIIKGGGAL